MDELVQMQTKELLDHVAGKASEGVNKATKDMCDRLSDIIAYTGTYAENNGISFGQAIDALNQPEEKAVMHQELREKWKKEATAQ